jgi:mono/diheme cytochrome c family protein
MRTITAACLVVLGWTAGPVSAQGPQDGSSGEYLYISRGCLGCHGASGEGGVGPSLARTSLPFDVFLDQVRDPRGIMPPFPEAAVAEGALREIYDYVSALPAPPPPLFTDAPTGEQDPASCATCHQDCHGTDHTVITRSKGRVPELRCAACHPQIYQEHVTDAGHSYGPGPAGIGTNWERNYAVPHYSQMPRKVMEMGCDPCHAQAGATADSLWSDSLMQYIDTSSLTYRNGCIACHTRHAFSLEEARKPEACYTCHMGPDHPNFEAYMSSKHGSIYAAEGGDWDWSAPMAEAEWDAPTCAYCHMLYVDSAGGRASSHNMTRKIIWGMGVQPAGGQLEDIVVTPENREKRNAMVRVCVTCHSEVKAREYLRAADAHKLAGDALVVEAREILQGLYADELIDPSHGQTAAGLLQGPRFTATELPTQFAQHWPAGLYFNVSAIEREYFDMFFFSNLKSYKGAFHMSPDYAWWYGYADVLGHLARIRDEADAIRDFDTTQDRAWFMILTGPLMVLAVLALVWFVRKRWLAE